MLRRLLVRLPNWLGDVLMARPLLHALRGGHPSAEIVAVAPARLLDLLASEGAVDRLESWPVERSQQSALAVRLRHWHPDAALVLPPSFSSAWFAWRTGARRRVGYAHEGRGALLTDALLRGDRGDLHQSREFMHLGEVLGVLPTPVPELRASADAGRRARALLERHGVGPAERYAILAPRSAWGPAREWPASRFVAVGGELARRGYRIVVCGVAAEREACTEIAGGVSGTATSLAGETDLPELVALCAGAVLAVCNDSGLAHLAAATGIPTVQIYGSASSAWTHALGRRVRVVCRPPVCSPCYQRICRIGYPCLTAVETAQVLAACDQLVSREAA